MIGLIEWPKDKQETIELLLRYQLKVLKELDINFIDFEENPVDYTSLYLKNKFPANLINDKANFWWNYIEKENGIQDFSSKNMIMARIALSILPVKERDISEIGEHLSWFLECLEFLGKDISIPIDLMQDFFSFSTN